MKNSGFNMLNRLWVSVFVVLAGMIQAQALTLNISDTGFDPIPAGGTIEYMLRVENGENFRSAADSLILSVPAGATYLGIAGTLTGCTPAAPLPGVRPRCPVPFPNWPRARGWTARSGWCPTNPGG